MEGLGEMGRARTGRELSAGRRTEPLGPGM